MSDNIDLLDSLSKDESGKGKEKIKETVASLKAEIDFIPDKNMQDLVSLILSESDNFWVSPADSAIDHHPPDEYSKYGMLLHTKRTFRVAFCFINTVLLEPDEVTALLSATLLHSVCKAILPNDGSPADQLYDHNYMVSIDQFISDILTHAIVDKTYPIMTNEEEKKCQQLMDLTIRLIHCSEGLMSPIPELYPTTPLENMMAQANIVAKSLHMIVDGVEENEERWLVGTELDN